MSMATTSNSPDVHDGNDARPQLIEQVQSAWSRQSPLTIAGADSRAFLANANPNGSDDARTATLSVADHHGVVSYEPTELVITARTGTPVQAIETVLKQAGQMLPFEPTRFAPQSTLGGVVASGLSGPARPYAGSVRDFVLGVECINGQGQALSFGGQVMKNVAGYDVSRLMTGAWGTLGVLTQVSFKVLPIPESVQTQQLVLSAAEAIQLCNSLAGSPMPVTAAAHADGVLHLRLSGSEGGVRHAAGEIGGDVMDDDAVFWQRLRDWRHPIQTAPCLWRLSLPAATPELTDLKGQTLTDWGGAQRWFVPDDSVTPAQITDTVKSAGGHASQVRGASEVVFSQPSAALEAIHTRLKDAFDPARIFNPNRFIAGL